MEQSLTEQKALAEAILSTLGEKQTFDDDPTMEDIYNLPDGKTYIEFGELYGQLSLTIHTMDFSLLPKILSEIKQSLSKG